MSVIVQIIGAASGIRTPHDDKYVVAWDPHKPFGILAITSTTDISKAHHFTDAREALDQWNTVSNIQPTRPTDGRPNKPLTGISIDIVKVKE